MLKTTEKILIYTDLDGTLLDHHSYSFQPAEDTLEKLRAAKIPVIINTSKTCAEVSQIRKDLQNEHPFIVENGASILIPKNYFASQPHKTQLFSYENEEFWIRQVGDSREDYYALIIEGAKTLNLSEGEDFSCFTFLGSEGIAKHTGLSIEQAKLANQRLSSEPVFWHSLPSQDAEHKKQALAQWLIDKGCRVIEGGRFMHVLHPDSTKGHALSWLKNIYKQSPSRTNGILKNDAKHQTSQYRSLALGDGPNDLDMLNAADIAVAIKPANRAALDISHHPNGLTSKQQGPKGWTECITQLLEL